MSGIAPAFRSAFIDCLACVVAPIPSWPRVYLQPEGEPLKWWPADALGILSRDLTGKLRASPRNYEIGGHWAFEHERRYDLTRGKKDAHGRDCRPDAPTGANAARMYMLWSPPSRVHWPTTTTPQASQGAPANGAALAFQAAPLTDDLVSAIGSSAFAALRAPYLAHLQAAYPADGFT